MIYIHTALSVEASPIIEGFKLKKDMDTKSSKCLETKMSY